MCTLSSVFKNKDGGTKKYTPFNAGVNCQQVSYMDNHFKGLQSGLMVQKFFQANICIWIFFQIKKKAVVVVDNYVNRCNLGEVYNKCVYIHLENGFLYVAHVPGVCWGITIFCIRT